MTALPLPSVESLKLGTLIIPGELESSLPLEHTDVVAQVTGPISSVSVKQRFANPFDHPIELLYLFPLPEDAAVISFEIVIGARVIRSRVEEIETARRSYEQARERGVRAGLVEQKRPNLVSIELANVQPGESIVATIRYQERVRFDDGEYRFIFPMGLTPKYHRGPAEGLGTDAPVAQKNAPIGTVDIQLSIDAGAIAGDPVSPSHAIDVSRLDERRLNIRTAGEIIPNKDFVVRYGVAEESVRAAAWTASGKGALTVLLTATPPRLQTEAEPAPREFVFVIDRSGSMMGGPMEQAKNALRACIRGLGSADTFAILAFSDRMEWFRTTASEVTQTNVNAADQWIARIQANGGTEIVTAVDQALAIPVDARRQRYVVFLTDGAVSAEAEVMKVVRKGIVHGRLFTFGIGPSVNRALLKGMAAAGKGTAEFLQVDEDIEGALIRFQDRVAYPALQDLEVRWKGATTWDMFPAELPDLYHGQPLELTARLQLTEPTASAVISGSRGAEKWNAEVPLLAAADDEAIRRIWAKARIDAILSHIDAEPGKAATLRPEVIALAIEHHLLTRYTSLVAIDDEVTSGGEAKKVRVSVPLPEGLVFEGFFGPPMAAAMPAMAAMQTGAIPTRAAKRAPAPPPVMEARAFSLSEEDSPALFGLIPRRQVEPAESTFDLSASDPLRDLAREQNVSGSWGTGATEIEMTAAAILAFVRRGHTTRSGHYRRQLAKAVKWLLAAQAPGIAAVARAIALAELGDATSDAALSALRATVRLPVAPITISNQDDLRLWVLHGKSGAAPVAISGPEARMWRAAMV